MKTQGSNFGRKPGRAALIALTVALVSVAGGARADTAAPTAGPEWGVDDYNTSTLQPYGPTFINSTAFLQDATKNTNFQFWNFVYVDEANRIPRQHLTTPYYQAWVVEHKPFQDPMGGWHNYPNVNGDAGGADFVMLYSPQGSGEPKANTVDFLQIVKTSINGGAPEYRIDNFGDPNSPYYGASGGSVGYANGEKQKWMTDIPFTCENGIDPEDISCADQSTDELTTSVQVTFVTYVVVPFPEGSDIQGADIYGGLEWGYKYTAVDIPNPEPGTLLLLGSGCVGLGGFLRKRLLNRS